MTRIVGGAMIVLFFAVMIGGTVEAHGWAQAAVIWGVALVLAACVIVGSYLVTR